MEEAPGPPLSHRATGSLLGVLQADRPPQQLSPEGGMMGKAGGRGAHLLCEVLNQ